MSLQTDIAKSHLETLIENVTGVVKAAPDIEGDYAVRLNGATFGRGSMVMISQYAAYTQSSVIK